MSIMPAAPLGTPPLGMAFTDSRMMSELPVEADQPWPPPRFNPIQADYRVWDAWWTGDPDKLMRALTGLLQHRRELLDRALIFRDHGRGRYRRCAPGPVPGRSHRLDPPVLLGPADTAR